MTLSRNAIQTLVGLVDDHLCDHHSKTLKTSGKLHFCRHELLRELHYQEVHQKKLHDPRSASNFCRRAKQMRCQDSL